MSAVVALVFLISPPTVGAQAARATPFADHIVRHAVAHTVPADARPLPLWTAADSPAPRGASSSARAVQSGAEQTPSAFDRIWRFATWYRNDSNPVVQQVLFSGRYQHDFVVVDADEGDHDESNVRRLRLGPKVTLLRTVTVHTEVELNPQERNPLYVRLTDAYVQWAASRRLAVTAGKHGVPFTLDGSTSSKDLLTIDRSNLANNLWFPQEYIPGVSVSGRVSPWTYRAGVFSAGRADREFGRFTGGLFTLGVLGYDLASTLGVTEASITGTYVYQDADTDNTFTRPLEQVASVAFRLEAARWGVRGDVAGGLGYLGQSDLWGVTAMPFVNLTNVFQLVARYTFLESEDANGVQLATYENRVVRGRGDRYRELYAGANYYFYGHRLKLQSGVQFGDLDDRADDDGAYTGVSWTTGLRVGW